MTTKVAKFGFAAAILVAAFAFAMTAAAVSATEIYTPSTGYLSVGSGMGAKAYQNSNVVAAQIALNACVPGTALVLDGKFGPLTKGKFMAFQASKNIQVDGIIGPVTAAQLAACSTSQPTPSNDNNDDNDSNGLSGGAGDLDISQTSTDIESSVKEDDTENVIGLKLEADGSDIEVTSVKVEFENQSGNGSTRLNKYVDEVLVMLGDEEVGSMSADDFSKDGAVYSKSIALDGAVIDEDDEAKLYVAVTALNTVDDTTADFDVAITQVRFEDATGAIFSESYDADVDGDGDWNDDGEITEVFGFDDANVDDDLSIKSWSENPDASNLMVEDDQDSEDYLVLAYKLDVDEDSSDIGILELPVDITINDSANTASSDSADSIIAEVNVEIDGESYEADLDADTVTNGDGTATYVVEFDEEEWVIDAGDTAEIKVMVTFNDQNGNYGSGTTVQAVTTGSDIDAEGEDDMSASGTATGKVHTLSVDAPTFDLVSKSLTLSQAIDGVAVGEEDIFVAKFVFDVTAPENDSVNLPLTAVLQGGIGTDGVEFTQLGSGTIEDVTLEAENDIEENNSYEVAAGDTERFTLSIFVRGDNASEKFTIDSFWYELSDTTPNGSPEVTTGISDFKTSTVFLAK